MYQVIESKYVAIEVDALMRLADAARRGKVYMEARSGAIKNANVIDEEHIQNGIYKDINSVNEALRIIDIIVNNDKARTIQWIHKL